MKLFIREHSLFTALLILLIAGNVIGWSLLFVLRTEHPDDTALYGTFRSDAVVTTATFATFDEDSFFLYHGQGGESIDQGTWTQSDDTAVLAGETDTYELVIKGNDIYLSGGAFDNLLRLSKVENTPVFISANT